MNGSMQDDLKDLLEKTKDTPLSEISSASREAEPALSAADAEPAPSEVAPSPHPNVNLADYLQAAREKALESTREFEKSLQMIRKQDPALAKKTKQVGIGIAVVVLIFIFVLLKSITGMGDNISPRTDKDAADQAAGQSEADQIRAAQDVNDNLRARNLDRIAELAAVYHLEQKADLPVSPSLVRLNESNPVSEYLKQALARYGQSDGILFDPRNPDFYYAYRSADGKSIELSARMENEAGKYCEYGKTPCIYTKTLTEARMQEMNLDLDKYK